MMAGAVSRAQRISFDAIGTRWEIDINGGVSPAKLKRLDSLIQKRISDFDKTYSRFRGDSLIMRTSQKTGRHKLPDDAKPLFEVYKKLYRATKGKVTPLVGGLLSSAGYDARYTLRPQAELTPAPKWEDAFGYEHPYLTLKKPALLDVGAVGKGYLVDIVGELLDVEGVDDYLIDAGGDMLRRSPEMSRARIGLEHPRDPSRVVGVVSLGAESICGSAANRRKWAGLHHIMDPDLAQPANDVTATWVVAKNAALADGLATALFFTRADALRLYFNFEYFLIRPDMTREHSPGLNAEIFGGDDE